jgi:hypothetical protein
MVANAARVTAAIAGRILIFYGKMRDVILVRLTAFPMSRYLTGRLTHYLP